MGPLPFNLEFFTECQDMRQLLAYLDAPPDTGDVTPADVEEQEDPSRDSTGGGGGGGCSEIVGRESGTGEIAGDEDGKREGWGGAEGPEGKETSSEDCEVGRRRRGRNERFYKMTEEICDVVDSYGLVCFYPLNIQVRLFPLLYLSLASSRRASVGCWWAKKRVAPAFCSSGCRCYYAQDGRM